MPNIINHYENTNENQEITTFYLLDSYWKITSVGEDVEKLEPSFTTSGNVRWYSCFGKQSVIPRTLSTKLSYDALIPTLCIYLREI